MLSHGVRHRQGTELSKKYMEGMCIAFIYVLQSLYWSSIIRSSYVPARKYLQGRSSRWCFKGHKHASHPMLPELRPMPYLPVLSFYVKSSFSRFSVHPDIVLAGTAWTVSIAFSGSFCSEFCSKIPLLAPLVLLTLATSAFGWTELLLFQKG